MVISLAVASWPENAAANLEVTYQFTGRPQDKFFDMEVFNGYQWRNGLTFSTQNGKINHLQTVLQSKPLRFLKDIKQLDLSGYDVVICDYEPITAWAARQQNKKTIGISHQYAFQYHIPRAGTDPVSEAVMRNFAPVDIGIGLHWHHFDQPILPPVIETPIIAQQIQRNKVVIYLPFEDQQQVMKLLSPFKEFEFFIYSRRHDFALCAYSLQAIVSTRVPKRFVGLYRYHLQCWF